MALHGPRGFRAAAPAAALLLLVSAAAGCATGRGRLPDIPTAEMLPPGVDPAHLHFTVPTVREGAPAPDFTLPAADGSAPVSLSSFRGRPLVLVFGSCTCPPFRRMLRTVEGLAERLGDRAGFLMVYVREAHPTDEWRMEANDRDGFALAQPRTPRERIAAAREFAERAGLGFPVAVDGIDDAVSGPYGGWPGRFLVLDAAGVVLYRSEVGPFGFRPAELEEAVEEAVE